jgi:hypothetical protein
LESAFRGQDAVVSLLGSAGSGEQIKLIDAAVAAGVKRFIPSDFGSDTTNPELRNIVPIFEGKKKVQDYMKSKDIAWTVVITGVFGDWALANGFLGIDIKNHTARLFGDKGNRHFTTSTLAQIGRAVVAVLTHAAETANQYVYIESCTTTQNEIISVIEKETGAKFTVSEEVDTNQMTADALKRFGEGDFSAISPMLQGGIFSEQGYGNHESIETWNDRLGLKKEKVEDWVKAVIAS